MTSFPSSLGTDSTNIKRWFEFHFSNQLSLDQGHWSGGEENSLGMLILSVTAPELASFDEAASAWVVAEGEYQFLVGASSQDIKATLTANAKSFQTKANDVMKPQVQMNLLKR